METQTIKQIIEALLFITDRPLATNTLKGILAENVGEHDVEQLVREIGADYEQRNSPLELRFIAGGWQFSSKKEFSPWIRRLYKEKTTLRLSPSALETLSIVAYKQPITRSEVEEIRGVEVSGVVETLLERKLIHIVGRKETIGRPLLYGTTVDFLKHFGLSHLSELPSLEEITPPEEVPPEGSQPETAEAEAVEPEIVEPSPEPNAEGGDGEESRTA